MTDLRDFDPHVRDTLRAAAATARADDDVVERLLERVRTGQPPTGRQSGRRVWLGPLLAAAVVAAVAVGGSMLVSSSEAGPRLPSLHDLTLPVGSTLASAPPSPDRTHSASGRRSAVVNQPGRGGPGHLASTHHRHPQSSSTALSPSSSPSASPSVPVDSSPPSADLPLVVADCATSSFEPAQIVVTCGDGNTIADVSSWTTWTATSATGAGSLSENDCTPDCAGGEFASYPAQITLSDPVPVGSSMEWTTLTATYADKSPHGQSTETFHLTTA